MRVIDRVLARLDGDLPGSEQIKIRAFGTILALVVCAEYWTKALERWNDLAWADGVALFVATLPAAGVVHGRWRRAAFALLAGLQLWYVIDQFPHAGNHRYLELVLGALLAWLDDERIDERQLLLRSLRWAVIVVLFYSGLQKLAHGYYFRGQFLAYTLGQESFRALLGPLLPAEELARLASCAGRVGDGPYRVSAPLFLVVSNATWIVETGLAVLLFLRSTRRGAWIAACAFVCVVQALARELMFGVEFAGAILLFARSDLIRKVVWPVGALLLALCLMRLGLVPEITFH